MTSIPSFLPFARPAPGPMPATRQVPDGTGPEVFDFALVLAVTAQRPQPAPLPLPLLLPGVEVEPGDAALPEVFADVPAGRGTALWPLPAGPPAFGETFPGSLAGKPGRETFPGRIAGLMAAFAHGGRDALMRAAEGMTGFGITLEQGDLPALQRSAPLPGVPGVRLDPEFEPVVPAIPQVITGAHGPPRGAMPPAVPPDSGPPQAARAPLTPLPAHMPATQLEGGAGTPATSAAQGAVVEARQGHAGSSGGDSKADPDEGGGRAQGGDAARARSGLAGAEASATFHARLGEAVTAPRAVQMARPAAQAEPQMPPFRAADQVTLQFHGQDGIDGRLRVSLRGSALEATLIPNQPGAMKHMEERLGELQRSLAERGFHDARVSIQVARTTDAGSARSDLRDDARAREEQRGGSHTDSETKRESSQSRSRRQSPGRQER